jgi:hypothetical protein
VPTACRPSLGNDMPRQKYLPHFAHLRYSIGALMLQERPEFCAAIGKCVGFWSFVDNEMGNLFSLVLGTDSEAALAVFLWLRRMRSQIELTKLAPEYKLTDPEELRVCKALLRRYGSLEGERNDLAHGCYGIAPDNPSILFWIAVQEHVHFQTDALSKEAKWQMDADRHARLKDKLYVYRQPDFDALYRDMEEFWRAVFYFNGYLRDRKNPQRVAEFQQLCARWLPPNSHLLIRNLYAKWLFFRCPQYCPCA